MKRRNVIKRAEFARLVGISAASVTRDCSTKLKAALVGKWIDADHPDAQEYIKKHKAKQEKNTITTTGLDPLYEDAISFCHEHGVYNAGVLRKGIGVGAERAKKIFEMMKFAGVVPEPGEPPPKIERPPQIKQKLPPVKGHAKKNLRKKAESLAKIKENKIFEIPDEMEMFADMTLRELIQRFGSDIAFVDWLKATKLIEEINERRLKNAKTKNELVSRELVKRGIIEPIDAAHIKMLTDGVRTLNIKITTLVKSDETDKTKEDTISETITSFLKPVKEKIKKTLIDLEKSNAEDEFTS